MKQTYRVVSGLVALGVLVQAAAIAFGWFDAIHELDSGLVIDENYEGNAGHVVHGINGMYLMPLLGLILLIVSFFAAKQVPGARKWAGIVFGLVVLQVVLAFVAFGAPIVGALHGLNALAILGTAVRASMLSREDRSSRRDSRTEPVDVPRQSTGSATSEAHRPVI
jgi:heme A synthase